MCIGQRFATLQVKAIMHQLLLHYRWSVPPDYVMPYQLALIAKTARQVANCVGADLIALALVFSR